MALRGRVNDVEESSHETGAVDDDKRIVEWGRGIVRSQVFDLRASGSLHISFPNVLFISSRRLSRSSG